MSSESESEEEAEEESTRPNKPSSKRETPNLKRKPPPTSQVSSKRQKSSGATAVDDPTRTYCLKKLHEIFSGIFLRYSHLESEDDEPSSPSLEKEEDKALIENKAKAFTDELEQSLFDIYAEHDTKGKASAASKYK